MPALGRAERGQAHFTSEQVPESLSFLASPAPRHHVGIDGLTCRFQLLPKALKALKERLPELSFQHLQSLRGRHKADREVHAATVVVANTWGDLRSVTIRRVIAKQNRWNRWASQWELSVDDRPIGTLALGGRREDEVPLDIGGRGCKQGFLFSLVETFARGARKDTVKVARLDIAIDLELDLQSLVVHQAPTEALTKRQLSRRHMGYDGGGLRIGDALLVYDGYRCCEERTDRDDRDIPGFIRDGEWSSWTRIEYRCRPGRKGFHIQTVLDVLESLNIRILPTDNERADLNLILARSYGLSLAAPLTREAVSPFVDPSKRPTKTDEPRDIWKDEGAKKRKSLDMGQFVFASRLIAGHCEKDAKKEARRSRASTVAELQRLPQVQLSSYLGEVTAIFERTMTFVQRPPRTQVDPWETFTIVSRDTPLGPIDWASMPPVAAPYGVGPGLGGRGTSGRCPNVVPTPLGYDSRPPPMLPAIEVPPCSQGLLELQARLLSQPVREEAQPFSVPRDLAASKVDEKIILGISPGPTSMPGFPSSSASPRGKPRHPQTGDHLEHKIPSEQGLAFAGV